MALKDTLQSLVNKDYEELLGLAKCAMNDVLPLCNKIDQKGNGIMMLTAVLMASVAADGKLSGLERKFIGELTGLNDEMILKLASTKPEETADLVDRFADILDDNGKAAVVTLVATIFACDEQINPAENTYLVKLLS